MSESNGQTRKKFALKLKEELVDIEDKDGLVVTYVVREMDGPLLEEFMASGSSRMKLDAKGNAVGVKNMKGINADLISRHLFRQSDNMQVTAETVKSWPSSVQLGLAKLCAELSGLSEKALEEAKND
jgi:hypothetical protein